MAWEDTKQPTIAPEDLPKLHAFAKTFWAPDMVKVGDSYRLYVTQFVSSDTNRLVVLTGAKPQGPFRFAVEGRGRQELAQRRALHLAAGGALDRRRLALVRDRRAAAAREKSARDRPLTVSRSDPAPRRTDAARDIWCGPLTCGILEA